AALRGRDPAHAAQASARRRSGARRGRRRRFRREVPSAAHAGREAGRRIAPTSWGPPGESVLSLGAVPEFLSEPGEAAFAGQARAPLRRSASRLLRRRDGASALPGRGERRAPAEVADAGLPDDRGAFADAASRVDRTGAR